MYINVSAVMCCTDIVIENKKHLLSTVGNVK